MNPTYTFDEAFRMISLLDLDGLKIFLTLMADEQRQYTYSEFKALHLYWNACYMVEKATEKQG